MTNPPRHTALLVLSLAALGFTAFGGRAYSQAQETEDLEPRREAAEPTATETEISGVELPAGFTVKDTEQFGEFFKADEAIFDVFAVLTETALGADFFGYDDFIDQFADHDRERLDTQMNELDEDPALDPKVREFKDLWEARYNTEFDIRDEDAVYSSLQIVHGEIEDEDAFAQAWPIAPMEGAQPEQMPARDIGEREQMDAGRDVAIVVVPQSGKLSQLTVSMIHEFPDYWKIDLPDYVDAASQIRALSSHLGYMIQNFNSLPADADEAYRHVTGHVLMAAYGMGTEGHRATETERDLSAAATEISRERMSADEIAAAERTLEEREGVRESRQYQSDDQLTVRDRVRESTREAAEETREFGREAEEETRELGREAKEETSELGREAEEMIGVRDYDQAYTSRLRTSVDVPSGIRIKEVQPGEEFFSPAEAIRDVFAVATELAFNQGELSDFAEQFVEADRNRLEDDKNLDEDSEGLFSKMEQFKEMWEARYNEEFDIHDEDVVFGPRHLYLLHGEITDVSALTEWPLSPMQRVQTEQTPVRDETADIQSNLEEGRDVAIVVLPGEFGMPEFTVSMLHESPDFWKIDIPDNVGATELKSHLNDHYTYLIENFDQLPANVEDAYRSVGRHILMASYGIGTDFAQTGAKDKSMKQGEMKEHHEKMREHHEEMHQDK